MKRTKPHNDYAVPPRSCLVDAGRAQDSQTQGDEYLDTLKSNLPQMSALFDKLASGEHPDFLTVMSAISEMVAFYTDSDLNFSGPENFLENRSQNKCRFCA